MSDDIDDELTAAINAAHPVRSGDHARYQRALELVGNRHSKAALVGLVNYLLAEIERAEANGAEAERNRLEEYGPIAIETARMNGAAKERAAIVAYLRTTFADWLCCDHGGEELELINDQLTDVELGEHLEVNEK